jgi:hypothetical protein
MHSLLIDRPQASSALSPALRAGVLALLACAVACKGSGTLAVADAAVVTPVSLGFTASNATLAGLDLSTVSDAVFTGASCTIDSTQPTVTCLDGSQFAFRVITQPDGTRAGLYVARTIRVEANTELTVTGGLPIILVALDRIDVLGRVIVAARSDQPGPGGFAEIVANSVGGGPGGGGAGSLTTAGGGGSFCGRGGAGAAESGSPAAGGAVYGSPTLVPITGGSSGGGGQGGGGGGGGGAIELVARNAVSVDRGGSISVGGGGGSPGGISAQEAAGGGSGGAILLEAATVTVAGVLAANGGGGGQGAGGDPGTDATVDDRSALGGHDGAHGPAAGNGSGGALTDGTGALPRTDSSGGGGGGGAGRIRINTRSGAAVLTGATLSPAMTTACATQGTLRP